MNHYPQKKSETLAVRFTRWMGSGASLIVHTLIFVFSFSLYFSGIDFDRILLFLTTAVSLEAIYLSLFIQMTVNRQAESIEDVAEDIDEIQEDIDEIQEDIDEISEDPQLEINTVTLDTIYTDLKRLMDDVENFKQNHPKS